MNRSDFWRSSLDPERVMQVGVTHWHEQQQQQREDYLTVEEPLELRIERQSLAVIMRTPGHDHELAMGFLLTEGVIQSASDVLVLEDALDEDGLPLANVVDITLRSERQVASLQSQPTAFERHFVVSASCGLCGKNSIADLLRSTPPLASTALQVPIATFYTLANQLRAGQAVFEHTGGLHAASLFNSNGELVLLREDVGRHNAVDKLIGHGLLRNNFPYSEHILLVSGRTSFEIVQKALLARIPFVAAVSAPSSLAVELAHNGGITLIGFLRGHSMNVYTHQERIIDVGISDA
ncbi:MAG: formate dehydrogenase accessory sulfurtransferase FdhD [Ktedonobacteraceae bacterium]|nr:formate dehydrogenase accessory sulfurtransferase FdhD [Ktedonobacteraceae bacterium]MBV9022141.1 formate dehydrogenase accessory sulfurtransferase FdhD [Ktedonobacteraceae bacterium]